MYLVIYYPKTALETLIWRPRLLIKFFLRFMVFAGFSQIPRSFPGKMGPQAKTHLKKDAFSPSEVGVENGVESKPVRGTSKPVSSRSLFDPLAFGKTSRILNLER